MAVEVGARSGIVGGMPLIECHAHVLPDAVLARFPGGTSPRYVTAECRVLARMLEAIGPLARRPGRGALEERGPALRPRARRVMTMPRPANSDIVASMSTELSEACIHPGEYVDSGAPEIMAFARRACGNAADDISKAVRLYYAVRDDIVYTPYCDFRSRETFRASACLSRGAGFCVAKAALLAAAARAAGIPARVGFADVRNHLTTPKLRRLMGTDTFYYHGYTELFLAGQWVKATPAFDRRLCEKFGVRPLEFDGRSDSLFHPYDVEGRRHMEYIRDRGPATDVPVDEILEIFNRYYPKLTAEATSAPATQFRAEAERALGKRPALGMRKDVP